jgi:hypothetical protein
MKKILLPIVCFFIIALANAQPPLFQWAKNIGGGSKIAVNRGNSITVDPFGNVYTTGYFGGTVDFDPSGATYNLTSIGGYENLFVSKLDPFGNFLWAKSMGGTSNVDGNSIISDSMGNVYCTGYFQGTIDFDPDSGIANAVAIGSYDVFILKIDPSGNFLWVKNIGGTSPETAYSIAIDSSGNIYATGSFNGTSDFDPSSGTFNLTTVAGGQDIFILKLDSLGNFVWAKSMGGACVINGYSIVVDAIGSVYATGYFCGTVDFDPNGGAVNLTSISMDVFISKLDSSGNFLWAKNIGGAGSSNYGFSIALDEVGSVYTTGTFSATSDFNPNSGIVNLTPTDGKDVFILKLDDAGSFLWAKSIGGVLDDFGHSLSVDAFSNIYITGSFRDIVDFDPGSATFNLASTGNDAMFISKLDSSGNFIWAKSMEGTSNVIGYSISVDIAGNVYSAGWFQGMADLDPSLSTFNLTASASGNIFIHKMSQPPLGISENENITNIHIYPNPNSGVFNIATLSQINRGTIEIFNILGALVYTQAITNRKNTIELNMDLVEGIYIYQVIVNDELVQTDRLIIIGHR